MNNDHVLCSVCTLNPSKYKCPKCLIPYCGVTCYQNHKQQCKPIEQSLPLSSVSTKESPKQQIQYKSNFLSEILKQKIVESNDVMKFTTNKRLVELMEIVLEEGEPTLNQLLNGTTTDDILFQNFAMRLLQTLGLRDEDGVCVL
ncbi:HIT-type domain-containing protein [Entamoeba marina]